MSSPSSRRIPVCACPSFPVSRINEIYVQSCTRHGTEPGSFFQGSHFVLCLFNLWFNHSSPTTWKRHLPLPRYIEIGMGRQRGSLHSTLNRSSMVMAKQIAVFLAALSLWITSSNFCDAKFVDTGVPCYLRPSVDRCHYRAKPDSPTCTSLDDRLRLAEGARQLNRSIAALEQKLIRLGVSKYLIQ